MSTITVCGTATSQVTPDYAVLSLAITVVGASASAATTEVSQRSERLEHLLGQAGIAIDQWTTEGVQVAEEWQWKNDTNTLIGYRATAGVAVTVRQFALLGGLITEAVDRCGANVRSLSWHADPDNPVRRSVLGDAARDAAMRAEAYAAALDLALGDVLAISERPFGNGSEPSPVGEARPMRAMKMADSGSMPVSGGQLEIGAEVHVQFAIQPRP